MNARRLSWIGSLIPILFLLVFMRSYTMSFPVDDQWMDSVPVAIAAENGTLTFGDLVEVTKGGHRLLFTHIHTVLFTWLLGWPAGLEALVNPLVAAASFVLLVLLLRHEFPETAHWVPIPFALCVFSIYQHVNWVMAWQSGWHFTNLFVVAALFVVAVRPPGWLPLATAAVFAVCAMHSRSHGILAWPVVLPLLWFRGYRRPSHYMVWVGLTALTAFLYLRGSGIGLASDVPAPWKNLEAAEPLPVARAIVGQLGAPFAVRNYGLAMALGVASVALLAANTVWLWLADSGRETFKKTFVWLALAAFGAGTSVVICAARLDVIPEADTAMLGGYATGSAMYWVAVAGIVAVATQRLFAKPDRTRTRSGLAWINVGAMMLAAPLYMGTQINDLNRWARDYEQPFGVKQTAWELKTERCLREFPLKGDPACLSETIWPYVKPAGEEIYALAALGLTVFRDDDPESILPPDHRPDSPVLVDARSPWRNAFVADVLLDGVPDERIVLVKPVREWAVSRVDRPRDREFVELSPDAARRWRARIAEVGEGWYVTTRYWGPGSSPTVEHLRQAGLRSSPVEVVGVRPYDYSGLKLFRLTPEEAPD